MPLLLLLPLLLLPLPPAAVILLLLPVAPASVMCIALLPSRRSDLTSPSPALTLLFLSPPPALPRRLPLGPAAAPRGGCRAALTAVPWPVPNAARCRKLCTAGTTLGGTNAKSKPNT